jgi:DNA-directed RNA polymerase specialized sigma24 family protein
MATMSTDGFPYIEPQIGEKLLEVLTMASAACTPNMTGLEEAGLIRKISGRQELFADLIAPHLRPLLHIVRATMGSHQDVALKAFTHLDQFRFEASFRTWLTRIGLNQEKYRVVILLRDLYGFSLAEVVERLGLTIPAVKTRQMRARRKMAKFLRPSSQSKPPMSVC